MNSSHLSVRVACAADLPALQALVERSVRGLGSRDYSQLQIESSLRHVFGVDRGLIADGTYFVAEVGQALAGAGGWSRRRRLYGACDGQSPAEDDLLDPQTEAARIRAFFVSPDWARRGVGRRLMAACETAAAAAGFRRLELLATLTGFPLYRACGFHIVQAARHTLPDGVALDGFVMAKELWHEEIREWIA